MPYPICHHAGGQRVLFCGQVSCQFQPAALLVAYDRLVVKRNDLYKPAWHRVTQSLDVAPNVQPSCVYECYGCGNNAIGQLLRLLLVVLVCFQIGSRLFQLLGDLVDALLIRVCGSRLI